MGRQSRSMETEKRTTLQAVPQRKTEPRERHVVLAWTVTFLIVALLAALLGFTSIAGTAAGIAKVLFVIFLVLFLVSLIFGRRATP